MSSSIVQESLSIPLPPAPPAPTAPKTAPPPTVAKPAPKTHEHNIISSTSIAKKVTQCLDELFPEPPAPIRGRSRITVAASAAVVKKTKPQIIVSLTAKSVSAPKAITICEILKRRISERGLYWYQYCALEEVLEEVKPKPAEPRAIPQRDTTRRSSWGAPPTTFNSPSRSTSSKPLNRSPLHSPDKPPVMGSLIGSAAKSPVRPLGNASTNSPARAPSRLLQRNSARSLKRHVETQPTVDEEDPFGPLSPPPERAQEEPSVKRVMPVLTIYLSTQRIDDYKERHG